MIAAPATRALGAGAATVALVFLPSAIAGPPGEEKPPAATTVVVEMTGDEGDTSPFLLKLTAPGIAQPAKLRDPTGLDTGYVTVLPAARCADVDPRTAYTDTTRTWCLGLEDVDTGSELTGTVTGSDDSAVPLTVRRRDGFFLGPFAVLVVGFVAGFLVALVPGWLAGRVRRVLLGSLAASPAVEGLREWIQLREAEGVDREAIIAAAHWAVQYGPGLAEDARARLVAAIGAARTARVDHHLPATDPDPSATARMDDLYDGAERRPRHLDLLKADQFERLAEVHHELEDQKREISLLPPQHRTAPERLYKKADKQFRGLRDLDRLGTMDGPLDELAGSIAAARAAAGKLARGVGPISAPHADEVRTAGRGSLDVGRTAELDAAWLRRARHRAVVLSAVLIVVLLGYAGSVVVQAGYAEKPLFHGLDDYADLFAAALASSAAAAVLTVLGYWKPGTPLEGEG